MNTLVIVESPAKAKKIGEYLGGDYKVVASAGHIRDLPTETKQISAKLREGLEEKYQRLGIDIPNNFKPLYIVIEDKKDIVKRIKDLVKSADQVLLATDGDAEGEAIAWHLAQVLGLKNPQRMVFHEITKEAITKALSNTRPLDLQRVAAQETRRIVDRLVGWEVTPKLREMGYKLSAGRVQSAALVSLAKREQNIMNHVPAPYYRVTAQAVAEKPFTALVVSDGESRLATAKDFGPDGELKTDAVMLGAAEIEQLTAHINAAGLTVKDVAVRPYTTNPPAPFTTSTLQQAASSLLKMSPQQTMTTAQKLYESGKITYMRTDSVNLSDEAVTAARAVAAAVYGAGSIPAQSRQYTSKGNAQEAHEAIRPAGSSFVPPYQSGLEGEELALYTLIYNCTVACQMNPLKGEETVLNLQSGSALLTASGRVILDAGFTVLYADESKKDADGQALPPVQAGQHWPAQASSEVKNTPAPGRFSEASLVKALESAGVGRPSTFANIISVLHERGFTVKKKDKLHVTWLGLLVAEYLRREFPALVNLAFTASMETDLDRIAAGELSRVDYLTAFWSGDLEQVVLNASTEPPVLALPQFPGVSISAEYRQVVMTQGIKSVALQNNPYPTPGEMNKAFVTKAMQGDEVLPPMPVKKKGARGPKR